MDAADFVRIAADRDRLAVLGRLAESPARAADLASALGITEREARRHLARLTAGGASGEHRPVSKPRRSLQEVRYPWRLY